MIGDDNMDLTMSETRNNVFGLGFCVGALVFQLSQKYRDNPLSQLVARRYSPRDKMNMTIFWGFGLGATAWLAYPYIFAANS
jgi:hypothetical protein